MEHHFNTDHAVKYGIEEAIVINNLVFWITKNKANRKHYLNDRTWTYNTYKAFSEIFPYWNEHKIKRILDSLVNKGVILRENYNKSGYDRTCWYAFKDEISFLNNCNIHIAEMQNGSNESATPIPYSNTINNSINNKSINISFETWWDLYDKKVGSKTKLQNKWNKLSDDQRTKAIEHTKEYIIAQPDKQYRKNPDTYLNNESFYDEIIKPKEFNQQVPTNKITTQIKLK
jgi:hypothetical protein